MKTKLKSLNVSASLSRPSVPPAVYLIGAPAGFTADEVHQFVQYLRDWGYNVAVAEPFCRNGIGVANPVSGKDWEHACSMIGDARE